MDRSRTKKALGSEEEEGRISSLSDEDLRARNKVLEPKDERKWLCLVGSENVSNLLCSKKRWIFLIQLYTGVNKV